MVNIYLFDVDGTIEVSFGPVTIAQMVNLKRSGHIIGLCGNWGLFVRTVQGWENLLSLIGPIGTSKALYMSQIKIFIPADRYIFVGNAPPDNIEARDAGWEFIREVEFKDGIA